KGGHMLGYALLAAAYWWGLGDRRPRAALLALLMAAIYATSDEFHQHFVAGRGSEVSDVLIDSTGAAIGLAAIQLSRRLRNWA
ncbi:MAG TPA: VanZ family protein, partial [Anaerolineales bacterium]